MNPKKATELLIDLGWTEMRIANAINASQPTVNRAKNGASVTYKVGSALVDLAIREINSHQTIGGNDASQSDG